MDPSLKIMNAINPLSGSRHLTHEAMNTTFHFYMGAMDDATVKSVVKECADRLELLEGQLSRFIEGSDVSRINEMAAGETLYLSDACYQCLLLACEATAKTHGLFDVTIGARIEHQKSGEDGPSPDLAGSLMIHPDVPAVTCIEPGRRIDFGGIGKGFALDQLKRVLDDWNVESALLTAGASSILAHGSIPWPIELKGDADSVKIELCEQSLSASGLGIQGSHIVHPWGDEAMPTCQSQRVWVVASSAALAEVWSTALMLIDADEIKPMVETADEIVKIYVDQKACLKRIDC